MSDSRARPVVSVIIPTRNRDSLLRGALDSVAANRHPDLDIELLVIDNGTGRETAAIASRAGARYIRSGRSGASAARNHGLEVAAGDYIAFLDDDDLWLPQHLITRVRWLEERHAFGALVGQACNVDYGATERGVPWPSLPVQDLTFARLLEFQPQLGATLVRRSVVDGVGPFDEQLLSDEDWDWHLRLALATRVGFLPVVCVLFRMRPAGSDDDLQWARYPFLREVYWRNVRRGGSLSPSLIPALGTYVHHLGVWCDQFLRSAKAHAGSGQRSSARTEFGHAARISPLHCAKSLLVDSDARRAAAWALLP